MQGETKSVGFVRLRGVFSGTRGCAIEAVGAGLLAGAVLLATAPHIPLVWDEGIYLMRASLILDWFGLFHGSADAPAAHALSEQAIARHWIFTTQEEGHPALLGWLLAVGILVAPGGASPLVAARLGPIAFAAIAVGIVFYRVAHDRSRFAAWTAVAALLTMPRLFAHLHFTITDGPLTSCWLIAWATFSGAVGDERGGKVRRAVLFGVALGLAFSAKATGWLVIVPFVFCAVLLRDRGMAKALAIGTPVALLVFWVLNPPLWHHPIEGFAEFARLAVFRRDATSLNIKTYFLGEMYDLQGRSLPWFNTLFLTAITVPVTTLALAAIGVGRTLAPLWRRALPEPRDLLLQGSCALLLAVRSLPGMPPHDGVRLFLPSIAFLAVFAGLGSGVVAESARRLTRPVAAHALGFLPLAALLGSFASTVWYFPQGLSYYNLAIGGLRGATAVGMEPTYYWDAFDDEVIDWLHRNTKEDEKVGFAMVPRPNLRWMQRWGTFQRGVFPEEPGRYRWYVVPLRPSGWEEVDRILVERETPAYTKTLRSPDRGWGPWRLDVPLLEIFSMEQLRRATRSVDRDRRAKRKERAR